MLCKEIGRPGMQPSFRQEDARIFTGYMEMGAKGSSSQMSPSALPRSLRMRLPSEIRPGRGDGWEVSSPGVIAVCHAWVLHTASLFFQGHVGPAMAGGGNGGLMGNGPHGGGRPGWRGWVMSNRPGRSTALRTRSGSPSWPRSTKDGAEPLGHVCVHQQGNVPHPSVEHISGAWA